MTCVVAVRSVTPTTNKGRTCRDIRTQYMSIMNIYTYVTQRDKKVKRSAFFLTAVGYSSEEQIRQPSLELYSLV